MSKTDIEWADMTWNPVKGCTKISPGCKHCYAETFAERWRGTDGHAYEQGFDLRLAPHKLHEPLTWTTPRLVFVNSMSDLFQEDLPVEYTARVFDVMESARWHTFQVLTKRADLLRDYSERQWERVRANGRLGAAGLEHVWIGVSVEDRKYGIPRIDLLRQTAASVRFLSIEPLLEDLGPLDLSGIDWVIVGGESGPGARVMRPRWVRDIREQCTEQGVRFFFKQWGGVHKKLTGRLLDGETYDDMPPLRTVPILPHVQRKHAVAVAKQWGEEWADHPLSKVREAT